MKVLKQLVACISAGAVLITTQSNTILATTTESTTTAATTETTAAASSDTNSNTTETSQATAETQSTTSILQTKQELDSAKSQGKDLANQLKAVEATITSLKNSIADTQEYIDALDGEMEDLASQIVNTNHSIDLKNEQIALSTEMLNAAQQREQEQYDAMKLRIKYSYENNDNSVLAAVLTASSISDLLNQAEYVSKITEYDRQKLEEYVATKEEIEVIKADLEREEAELEDVKAELETQQASVQLLIDAKNQEITELQKNRAAYEKKEKELEKAQEELDALISSLTAKYNAEQLIRANAVATQSALYSKTLLLWPCPSSHTISSGFSLSRVDPVTGSYSAPHRGTDIAAPTGTPVVAAASGLVTAAGFNASMGNYVVISHGDGISTRYYHNSSLAVSEGQAVSAGQTISYVGSTGWSTGPHLHFEVRINDVAYDAMQFY
ncbi:MAG: peptidoglycan DD-metalloendopeptidase family protein [Lachnospiraceae bacterium]|nr:peptidoglycan DD-metalloendopeptidase family protein [Lachnospiraceae bacterium]